MDCNGLPCIVLTCFKLFHCQQNPHETVKRIQKGGEECTEIIRTPPKPWSTGSLLSSMAWTPRTKNKGCPMCTVCRAVLIQHIQLNHKTSQDRFFLKQGDISRVSSSWKAHLLSSTQCAKCPGGILQKNRRIPCLKLKLSMKLLEARG